jgi:hypothetical protein
MNDQQAIDSSPGDVKTCPSCGGTWPAARTHCLACGTSLADVPAQPPEETRPDAPFDWRWLDAMAREHGEEAGPPPVAGTEPPSGAPGKKGGPGWLARLLGRRDKGS